jgi:ssDNA-binding Zn-finger/Zn-ribbon topoisomerase 1
MTKNTRRKPRTKPLYRCPFCGGPASIRKDHDSRGWLVGCAHTPHADPDCCPIGPQVSYPFISKEAARRAWNTRNFPRPLTPDEIKQRDDLEWHRQQMRTNPAYRQSIKEAGRERYNNLRRLRRRKPVMLDLSAELEPSDWTCPDCSKTYGPHRTTYISPTDYKERCPDCAEAFARSLGIDS